MLRLAALLVVSCGLAAGAQATADTLHVDTAEAIRLALADSPEVNIEQAGLDFAQARAAQARAARYLTTFQLTTAHAFAPALDVPDDLQHPRGALYLDPRVRNDWNDLRPYNQFEVELLQPLFTWGEIGAQIRAADAGVDVERAQTEAQVTEVALRTAELVEGLAAAEELVRLAVEAQRVLGEARTELTRLLDEGDPGVSDADLFQLRIFEQELQAQQIEVGQRRAIAASALGRQVRRPGVAIVTPTLAARDVSVPRLEQVQAVALQNRSEVRQASAGIRAREALVQVARSDYYPKLFVGAYFTGRYAAGRERQPNPFVNDPYIGGGIRAGLGVRQNLAVLQIRARVQQAEAQLSEVRNQQIAAEQLVLFEVEEAYRNLAIAVARLDAREEAARIAAEWLRTEQINFDLELGEVRDLVAAARADLEARLARIEAIRALNVAALRLQAASGTLARRSVHGTQLERNILD